VMMSCAPEDFEAGVAHLRAFARIRPAWVLTEMQSAGGRASSSAQEAMRK
jgi:hypothetical protein